MPGLGGLRDGCSLREWFFDGVISWSGKGGGLIGASGGCVDGGVLSVRDLKVQVGVEWKE